MDNWPGFAHRWTIPMIAKSAANVAFETLDSVHFIWHLGVCPAEALLLRTRHSGAPFLINSGSIIFVTYALLYANRTMRLK